MKRLFSAILAVSLLGPSVSLSAIELQSAVLALYFGGILRDSPNLFLDEALSGELEASQQLVYPLKTNGRSDIIAKMASAALPGEGLDVVKRGKSYTHRNAGIAFRVLMSLYKNDKWQFYSSDRIYEMANPKSDRPIALNNFHALLWRLKDEGPFRYENCLWQIEWSEWHNKSYYRIVPWIEDSAPEPAVNWNGFPSSEVPLSDDFQNWNGQTLIDYVLGPSPREARMPAVEARDASNSEPVLLADEIIRAYEILLHGKNGGYSAGALLKQLKESRGVRQLLLRSPEELERGFQWLEMRGFPIRLEARRNNGHPVEHLWVTKGLVRRRFYNLGPIGWPEDAWRRWTDLNGNDSTRAIAARIDLLLEVFQNRFTLPMLAEISGRSYGAVLRQVAEWRSGEHSSPGDALDAAIDEWAQVFGIEASWLRWGMSKQAYEAKFFPLLGRMPRRGMRIESVRRLRGLSRAALAQLADINPLVLRDLEAGRIDSPTDVSVWPRLAAALNVDVYLLLTGETRQEAFARRSPKERMDLAFLANGQSMEQMAEEWGTTVTPLRERIKRFLKGAHSDPDFKRFVLAKAKLSEEELFALPMPQEPQHALGEDAIGQLAFEARAAYRQARHLDMREAASELERVLLELPDVAERFVLGSLGTAALTSLRRTTWSITVTPLNMNALGTTSVLSLSFRIENSTLLASNLRHLNGLNGVMQDVLKEMHLPQRVQVKWESFRGLDVLSENEIPILLRAA